jgi:hypothetical protein
LNAHSGVDAPVGESTGICAVGIERERRGGGDAKTFGVYGDRHDRED